MPMDILKRLKKDCWTIAIPSYCLCILLSDTSRAQVANNFQNTSSRNPTRQVSWESLGTEAKTPSKAVVGQEPVGSSVFPWQAEPPVSSRRSQPRVGGEDNGALPTTIPWENLDKSLNSIPAQTTQSTSIINADELWFPAIPDGLVDTVPFCLLESPTLEQLESEPAALLPTPPALALIEVGMQFPSSDGAAEAELHHESMSNVVNSTNGNHPINLESLAAISTRQSSNDPIGILPIARIAQPSTSINEGGIYNTAKYIGPMEPAEEMFFKLNIAGEFQSLPGETLQEMRTSMDENAVAYPWMSGVYTWASPTFFHRPLYFEQVNLERYGMGPGRCIQPFFSGMHFFSSVALMPYKVLTQHPHERVYSLGYQRPGNPACYQGRSLLGQSRIGEACRYWDSYAGYQ